MPLINSKRSGCKIPIPIILLCEKTAKLNPQHRLNVTTLLRDEGLLSRDESLDSRGESASSRESVTRVSTVLVSLDMKNSICEAMLCSLLFFFIHSSKFLNFPVEISMI